MDRSNPVFGSYNQPVGDYRKSMKICKMTGRVLGKWGPAKFSKVCHIQPLQSGLSAQHALGGKRIILFYLTLKTKQFFLNFILNTKK